MRKLLIAVLALAAIQVQAQTDSTLVKEVQALKRETRQTSTANKQLRQEVKSLRAGLLEQQNTIDSLSSLTQKNTALIAATSSELTARSSELSSRIKETGDNTHQSLAQLDGSLNRTTLFWSLGLLVTALLGGVSFVFLRKRLTAGKSDVEQQIHGVQKSLEEESIRLDNKLLEILDAQVKLMKEERANTAQAAAGKAEELDHSLALKVADEITRIQMNLGHMDPTVKGLKQLDRAVKAIVNNFQANGYEIVEMLNKPYDDGMKIIATMEIDDKLAPGQQLIKRIIKPQINYRGQMIQAAQVVVAFGE